MRVTPPAGVQSPGALRRLRTLQKKTAAARPSLPPPAPVVAPVLAPTIGPKPRREVAFGEDLNHTPPSRGRYVLILLTRTMHRHTSFIGRKRGCNHEYESNAPTVVPLVQSSQFRSGENPARCRRNWSRKWRSKITRLIVIEQNEALLTNSRISGTTNYEAASKQGTFPLKGRTQHVPAQWKEASDECGRFIRSFLCKLARGIRQAEAEIRNRRHQFRACRRSGGLWLACGKRRGASRGLREAPSSASTGKPRPGPPVGDVFDKTIFELGRQLNEVKCHSGRPSAPSFLMLGKTQRHHARTEKKSRQRKGRRNPHFVETRDSPAKLDMFHRRNRKLIEYYQDSQDDLMPKATMLR